MDKRQKQSEKERERDKRQKKEDRGENIAEGDMGVRAVWVNPLSGSLLRGWLNATPPPTISLPQSQQESVGGEAWVYK